MVIIWKRIAHGMLSASLFSTLVGMHIPGISVIYKSQTLEFLRPVFIGDTLCALNFKLWCFITCSMLNEVLLHLILCFLIESNTILCNFFHNL
ncbi:MAG: hypothetical protein K8S13_00925 [Desulfobacula sp.]|uniref:MaoC/PaaZ C-terminal domain-containing protein n=1 Tax=Desulfobacula sp. TaxID=2593537 RepID=UPI00345B4FF4|nr:hypothetical protein [Desulfobacula sp.]